MQASQLINKSRNINKNQRVRYLLNFGVPDLHKLKILVTPNTKGENIKEVELTEKSF